MVVQALGNPIRIVEAYVARHGPDAWRDVYDLPAEEVWRASGLVPLR